MSLEVKSAPCCQWRENLTRVFGLDLRSLALFRIAMGALLLTDLLKRFQYLEWFYVDDGFYTRELSKKYWLTEGLEGWSVFSLSGDAFVQTVLFGVAGLFALAMLCGCLTRIATIVSWVMLVSIQVRCPVILNGGDVLFRELLLWSIFLPLGRCWSVDSLFSRRPRLSSNEVVITSIATAAIILQLFFMYWFAGFAKCNDIWYSGIALEYVMRLELFRTPLGTWLLGFPVLMKFLTVATLILEIGGPTLLLFPWKTGRARYLVIGSFFAMHIGIALTLSIGLFSLISMSAWMILLPSSFWRTKGLWWLSPWKHDAGEVNASQRETVQIEVGMEPASGRLLGRLVSGCVGLMLVYALLWNLAEASPKYRDTLMPKSVRHFGWSILLAQQFEMFGVPPTRNAWFVYRARLANGDVVDLLSGRAASEVRPTDMVGTFPSHRFRKLHLNFVEFKNLEETELALLEFYVRKWNREQDEEKQIVEADLICFMEMINDQYRENTWTKFSLAHAEYGEQEETSVFSEFLDTLERGGSILP